MNKLNYKTAARFSKWNTVSCLLLFTTLLRVEGTHAQSTRELEEQVLGVGSSSSSSTSSESSSPEPSNYDTSSYDVELPQFDEKPKEVVRPRDLEAIEAAVKGPKEIPQNHILVVQRRYIQKEERHEVIPAMIGLQPADSFRRQLQWGFGYVYHLTESFGIEAIHANVITNFNTGLARTIRESVNLEADRIEPVLSFGSTLQWTPLRSKAAAHTSLHYFEGYFLGGGGISRFEDQSAPLAMFGVGFRIYLTRFAIFKAEVRDYIDFKKSGTDYRFNLLAGVGVLLGNPK